MLSTFILVSSDSGMCDVINILRTIETAKLFSAIIIKTHENIYNLRKRLTVKYFQILIL